MPENKIPNLCIFDDEGRPDTLGTQYLCNDISNDLVELAKKYRNKNYTIGDFIRGLQYATETLDNTQFRRSMGGES